MRNPASSCTRALCLACTLAMGVFWPLSAGVVTIAAEERKAILLLPIASGTAGQEWSAKALGGILEDGFSALRSVRLVAGTAREDALRELAASATVTPEAFRDICRRAGADLAVLGGSTLVEGRLSLEIKIFDVAAARELPTFRGDEPAARAFNLIEAAIRHVAAEAALGSAEALFPGGVTVSLEAYAAYRTALLEEVPAARVEKLREVLKLDAAYADPTRRLGTELFRQGSLNEALGVLERAVALGPKVAEARNNLGVALAAAGRPEQAQREFEEAVSLAPDYAEARLNLARVFEDRGRPADAEKQYTAVLDADAGNDKARAGRAALYDSTGRPELALKEFRLLSARRPDLAEAEFIRAGQEARKAREYPRAEKYFLRATDINPQVAQAWAELGTNSYLAGEYPKGVEYFRKALTIDPGQAAYHYYLGLALDKGRQQDEAVREYRRAVELGGPPEARLGLARAALAAGDPGLAVEELNRLLVASPDHAEAKVLLAQATSEMEARRRLVEGQSQFANQRLARLEQIVADANRANRELEARLQSVMQEKRLLKQQALLPDDATAADEATRESERARELERFKAELAAAETVRVELAKKVNEAAELKGQLRAAQGAIARAEEAQRTERERGERALAAEREDRRSEVEKLRAELALGPFKKPERDRMLQDLAAEKSRTVAAQAAREKAERSLAAEREARIADVEKLKTELAAERVRKEERDRLAQELAGEKARARADQAAREKAEQAQATERASRQNEIEKLKTELAVSTGRAQERDRLAQELAGEKARARADQAACEKAEQAVSSEREQAAKALAAEREGSRRQAEQVTARIGALEAQVRTQAQALQDREVELTSARTRESSIIAQRDKGQADLVLLAERQAALEARAVAEARTLAERERALEKALQVVRDLALELGRNALQAQSWEKARAFLERAVEADPRSGEAWYGLGEAFFQLGQYEKSKQMYDRAKEIY